MYYKLFVKSANYVDSYELGYFGSADDVYKIILLLAPEHFRRVYVRIYKDNELSEEMSCSYFFYNYNP